MNKENNQIDENENEENEEEKDEEKDLSNIKKSNNPSRKLNIFHNSEQFKK